MSSYPFLIIFTSTLYPMEYFFSKIDSPVGVLTLVATDLGLHDVLWKEEGYERTLSATEGNEHPVLLDAAQQLQEYFEHKRTEFHLPLHLEGTPFQHKVWEALLTIPYGKTCTYGELARQTGDAQAARAIGGAVNKNPVAIIVPCHRVIGHTGALVGFAGGMERKAYLLHLERSAQAPTLFDLY